MDYVTVAALKPVAINHFLLYPGERRVILRGLAEQVMREYPGRLVIVLAVEPVDAEPLPVKPTPDEPLEVAEPQAAEPTAPAEPIATPARAPRRPRKPDLDA